MPRIIEANRTCRVIEQLFYGDFYCAWGERREDA